MLCPVARPNRNNQESTVNRERAGRKVLTETISLQVQVPVGHTATLKTTANFHRSVGAKGGEDVAEGRENVVVQPSLFH